MQFRQIFSLSLSYLVQTYRGWSTIVFWIAMPIAFTAIIGLATGPSDSKVLPIAIVNQDNGAFGQKLIDKISSTEPVKILTMDAFSKIKATADSFYQAVFIIPPGFSQNLPQGATEPLTLYVSAENVDKNWQLEEIFITSIQELYGIFVAARISAEVNKSLSGVADGETTSRLYEQSLERAVSLESEYKPVVASIKFEGNADSQSVATGLNQSSPGMLIMFSMLFALSGTTVLLQEREQGTLRRLMLMPITKTTLILGKLSGVYVAGLIQIALLIVAGYILFDVAWDQAPISLVIVTASYMFAVTSFGMLIASIAKTFSQANSLSTTVVMGFASLGGAWWPLDIVPEWMRTIGYFVPTSWAMEGFQGVILHGDQLHDLSTQIIILLAFGLLYSSISIWRFKFE